MRQAITALCILALILGVVGCAGQQSGRQSRRQVYFNLMTPYQQSQFLRLEAREEPESILLAYLQEIRVYQAFANQPKEIQDAVLHRRVEVGMEPLQVQMAWGPPLRSRDASSLADRAAGNQRIIWDYVFYSRPGGQAEYQRSVCFLNDRVVWMRSAIP